MRNGSEDTERATMNSRNQYANTHTHSRARPEIYFIQLSSTYMLMHPTKLNLAWKHNAEFIFFIFCSSFSSFSSRTRYKLYEKFQIEVAPNIFYYTANCSSVGVCVCVCTEWNEMRPASFNAQYPLFLQSSYEPSSDSRPRTHLICTTTIGMFIIQVKLVFLFRFAWLSTLRGFWSTCSCLFSYILCALSSFLVAVFVFSSLLLSSSHPPPPFFVFFFFSFYLHNCPPSLFHQS